MRFSVSGGAATFLAAAAVASAPALAQAPSAERSVEISKVFAHYDKYLKLPAAERSLWDLSYRLTLDDNAPTGAKVWYVRGGARTPIAVAADGRLSPTPTLADYQNKTMIAVAAPGSSKYGVRLEVVPKAPPAARVDAQTLAASAVQATRGAKKAAGLIGLAVPKFERVYFAGATGAVVETPAGAKPLPVEGANKTPYFDPKAWPGATVVAFEKAPTRMLLAPAGK